MVETEYVPGGMGGLCSSLLAELPEWFGTPDANADYVRHADEHPGVVAWIEGEQVGLTTVVRHGPFAAEVHLMAVRRRNHRQGVGRAMLHLVETRLGAEGVEFLQVKTLSSLHPDVSYAHTRAFYLGYGFRVLEEHPSLWGPDSPAVQLIKAVHVEGAGSDSRS